MTSIQLKINGLTCAHCAKGVEDHLREMGLKDARVNFSSSSADFTELAELPVDHIMEGLRKIGYKASLANQTSGNSSLFSSVKFLTIFCCILASPLVLAELIHIDLLHNPYFQLGLTLPIMLSGGLYFTHSAIRSLRIRKPNMDVLIAIGTWSAFIYSTAGVISGLGEQFLFYETSASIVAIVLLGNFLEARAISRTEDSLLKLQQLRPDSIRIRNPDTGQTSTIVLDAIKKGDQIILSPGDRIPVDGRVIDGSAELDESFLSGESLPRSVSSGDSVSSGASIIEGNLSVLAENVAEESSLLKIIRTIQDARAAKPSLERLADQLTSYFVPVVLAIAAITFFANILAGIAFAESMLRSIAVLVIACPCALGLATPTAVTVALGIASRLGILVRKASVFELMPGIRYFFFDKTGTLTDGKFHVEEFNVSTQMYDESLQLILGLESLSHHPIAQALRDFCLKNGADCPFPFAAIDEQRARGVFGQSESGDQYELSSREVPAPYNLALRKNNSIIASIRLSDTIRSEAPESCDYLRKNKSGLEILSGDSVEKTSLAARTLNITNYKARLLPAEKAEIVAEKEKDVRVAFVGDGINDAAALARASLGITFGSASDLARQSADVTIISGGLERIVYLHQLARKTSASIRQNLFWAFFYNIIFIPVAALGMLSPMHAALAMVLSDVIVVANSLRLKLWKPQKSASSGI